MDFDIKVSTLDSKSSELETHKSNAEDIYNEFNSCYISTISDAELSSIKSKLKQPMERLKKGVTNSHTWFTNYIKELNSLEDALASFQGGSLTTPTEFKGEFVDMFGKRTMPIIKTGGDIHANANQTVIHNNDGSLIISNESGYVFPFEKGVNAPVTSSVGPRNAPVAGASTNHKGTDIGVAQGTPIHCISGGTVINAGRGDAGGFGNWVRVKQDDGNIVIYGHVSKSDYFKVGDRVEAGDVIANVGSEGYSTGPHLHLEIHDKNDQILNSEHLFQDCWP
jgi:murein DD-endopeptidase MepM/ murein hydrolase activator NlpD